MGINIKRIIVAGAAGFLGSHLVKTLLNNGDYVIGMDNLSTGLLSNLSEVMEHPNFKFMEKDICDKDLVDSGLMDKVEQIYHLASPASPKFYREKPLETIAANTIGTQNLLELAKRNKAKLLYASTSEAYGDPEIHPQKEEYYGNVNTWGPRACYDESKRLGEVFCYEYFNLYQVEVKVVRLFNTYSAGLRNDDGRVISNFVNQSIAGEDITVYGDGSQTRSFCYVDDTIKALRLVMNNDNATGEIINIGNPNEYTILEVAQLVKKLTNSNSRITFHDLPENDPKVRRPDIDKARRILNWEPEIHIESGLKRTIEAYKTKDEVTTLSATSHRLDVESGSVMKVVCIGAGYVGSVYGTFLAALGHETTLVDSDHHKIEAINSGKSPVYEPGLDELIGKFIGNKLNATTSYEAVKAADVVLITVGTPSNEDGSANLKYICRAAENIGEQLKERKGSFTVIVNKSTVPVGTADLVRSIVEAKSKLREHRDFAVVSNPEFLREGFALEDVFFPEKIIVGSENDKAKTQMRKLFENLINRPNFDSILSSIALPRCFSRNQTLYFETDTKSAELIKYVTNAFLAVKVSYANEMARLSDKLGANITDVMKGMGLDSRIGSKFLQISSGWSGSCLPKDTAELVVTGANNGVELCLVKAAIHSNDNMMDFCVEKLQKQLRSMDGKVIGVLGLTFKPDTDDARNTQASVIIEKLLKLGASIRAYDPQGMSMFQLTNPDLKVVYVQTPLEVVRNADAVLLLTHWNEFLDLDWEKAYQLMNEPYIFDSRNFLTQLNLERIGFMYEGIGIGMRTDESREKDKFLLFG